MVAISLFGYDRSGAFFLFLGTVRITIFFQIVASGENGKLTNRLVGRRGTQIRTQNDEVKLWLIFLD